MADGPLDIFLKLDGIEGESTDAAHANETVVLSYEGSVGQTLGTPVTGGWDVRQNRKI